jgi:hypothetical protein
MTVWPADCIRWVSAQSGHRGSGSLLRSPRDLFTQAGNESAEGRFNSSAAQVI